MLSQLITLTNTKGVSHIIQQLVPVHRFDWSSGIPRLLIQGGPKVGIQYLFIISVKFCFNSTELP